MAWAGRFCTAAGTVCGVSVLCPGARLTDGGSGFSRHTRLRVAPCAVVSPTHTRRFAAAGITCGALARLRGL